MAVAAAGGGRQLSAGSARSMPSRSSRTAGPGSTPNSSARIVARRWKASRAFGLPPIAIQREHQLRPQPLAQRAASGRPPQPGDDLGMPAEGQLGVEVDLAGARPPLGQRRHVLAVQHLGVDVRQRVAAPQRQGLPEQVGTALWIGGATRRHERVEAGEVEGGRRQLQEVAAGVRRDQLAGRALDGQGAAQPPNQRVQRGSRVDGCPRAPDPIDERGDAHRLTPVEQQRGQQCPLPVGRDGDGAAVPGDAQRAEHGEIPLHESPQCRPTRRLATSTGSDGNTTVRHGCVDVDAR